MIISISGAAGSGKSTLAKRLAEELGWTRYYIGGLRREAARKRGMTLTEYNQLGESDPSTDLEVDRFQEELGKKEDDFVIEGRTSWHFIPHSLKIYLDVDERVGAERIFEELQRGADRNEDKEIQTVEDTLISNRNRKRSDTKRYREYFDIDVYNPGNYDYVLDTSGLSEDEVFDQVYRYINLKRENF